MSDFLAEKKNPATGPKQVLRLHRRLFLLVFGVAVLLQALVFADTRLGRYYQELEQRFKVILTVDAPADNAALSQMGESLNQKEDISSVRLFSPEDALGVVKKQNARIF